MPPDRCGLSGSRLKQRSASTAVDVVALNVEVEGVVFLARNDVFDALPSQVENGFQTAVLHRLKPDGSCGSTGLAKDERIPVIGAHSHFPHPWADDLKASFPVGNAGHITHAADPRPAHLGKSWGAVQANAQQTANSEKSFG